MRKKELFSTGTAIACLFLFFTSCKSDVSNDLNQLTLEEQMDMVILSIESSQELTDAEKEKLDKIAAYAQDQDASGEDEQNNAQHVATKAEGKGVSSMNSKKPSSSPVPFVVIEEPPIFPGCEDSEDKQECFEVMLVKHIKRNFEYPDEAASSGQEGKVAISFTIMEDGSVGNIMDHGGTVALQKEAERIIKMLPKMIPGKQGGVPVKVSYAIPVVFDLQ